MERLRDTWSFLKKLTLKKVFNAFVVIASFQLTRLLGRAVHWGMPISLSIEPTTACNLNCPECPSGLRSFSRPTGNLKTDFFRNTVDQVSESLINLTFYFQGEPYINPQFLNMVAYANKKGLYTMTSTNGHFLSEENCRNTIKSGLDRIIISIDGTTQEVYEQYRKSGSLAEVINGTKRLIHWKKKLRSSAPYIIFQFLVVRPNEHQIEEVKQLASDLGVNEVRLKTAQIYDYQNGHPLIPTQEKYARYKKVDHQQYTLKNSLKDECWRLWHSGVITWDGQLIPCCFDKDAQYAFGTLKNQPFTQLWKGQSARQFRSRLMKGRKEIEICTNCTEGCAVWS